MVNTVEAAYDAYDFPKVYQTIQLFCNNTLSATYHDIIKDRLYTLAPNDAKRRSSQTVLNIALDTLVRVLSPILPFTCDEARAYLESDSDFSSTPSALLDWPEIKTKWNFASEAAKIQKLLTFKAESVNDKLEACRTSKEIGQSLEAKITIQDDDADGIYTLLNEKLEDLSELFIVSLVEVVKGTPDIAVSHAPGVRCPRSWRWVDALHETENWGAVSARDKAVHDTLYGISR